MLSARGGAGEEEEELKRRLEKLSRTYDLTTMKIFMTVEALGEANIYNTYDADRKANWEAFLSRREACRLDLGRHDKTRERYQHFLHGVEREEQGKLFYYAMMDLLQSKGAVDVFPNAKRTPRVPTKQLNPGQPDASFCTQICRLLDRKLETWFDSFQAVNIRLTAHVKVSNLVRLLSGQIDLLCRKDRVLYAVNVKVTGMATPRPMDVNELCLVKAMVIQNGLAHPDSVVCCLLVCHLGDERPVLRLWEHRPSMAMDSAIWEADIDKMIEAGRLTENHELWRQNMCPPGHGSQTARLDSAPVASYNGMSRQTRVPNVAGYQPVEQRLALAHNAGLAGL